MNGESHVSPEMLARFFRQELTPEERKGVVRHLLTRCASCRETAHEAGERAGVWGPHPSVAPEAHDEVFERLLAWAGEQKDRTAREKLLAAAQWAALERTPQELRRLLVLQDESLHTWALLDRLIEVSRRLQGEDPRQAVEVAELAVEVAAHLNEEEHGAERLADLQAGALAQLGNARRVAADFEGAEQALIEAGELLSEGTGDPYDEARLIGLRSSLLGDLGRFEEAVVSLERAVEIYRSLGDAHMLGRTLVKQAAPIWHSEPGRAQQLAREALRRIYPVREPRLVLAARHVLALALVASGEPEQALQVVEMSRPLYRQFPEPGIRLRLQWLEGAITRAFGNLAGAEQTFNLVSREFLERGMHQEHVLAQIDLMEVQVAQGKVEQAVGIVSAVYPLLRSWGMHDEGLAVVLLLGSSLVRRTQQAGAFRSLTDYFRRNWHRPASHELG